MTDELVFGDPPPRTRGRGLAREGLWLGRLAPLTAHPGVWARVLIGGKGSVQGPAGTLGVLLAHAGGAGGRGHARRLGALPGAGGHRGAGRSRHRGAPPKTLAQVYIRNPCRVEACTRPQPHARTRWCTDTGYAQRAQSSKRGGGEEGRADGPAPDRTPPPPVAPPTRPADPLRAIVELPADPDEVERRARMERAIAQAGFVAETGSRSRLLARRDERLGRRGR